MGRVIFEGVWKVFDDVVAVKDLNLEIRDGEFLVLVGPSGCGKTTSLRMLAGLEKPSYGRVWMDDHDVTVVPPGRRDVAMVFQSYALYPHMTVFKNLAFGPSVRHEPKQELKGRIQDVAELLGIADLLGRRPNELSGGQRQRVALGRSLVREPRLFLLDEPLSNLDAALRVQMRGELLRLHARVPVTTVYVTHDQVEALTMGDRVVVFNKGEVLQVGTPDQLYSQPTNSFVAEFIGSPKINFFPGELAGITGGTVAVRCLDQTFVIPDTALADGVSEHAKITVGIRPHDLLWAEDAPARCTARLPLTIEAVQRTGSEIFVEGVYAPQALRLMARLHRASSVQAGDTIDVCFSGDDLRLFAIPSGDAVLRYSDDPKPARVPAEEDGTKAQSVGMTQPDGLLEREVT